MNRPDSPTPIVASPVKFLLLLLLIIFAVETGVMILLPLILSGAPPTVVNLADSCFLTLFTAPFIWFLIARPLRLAAVHEATRTEATLANIVDAVIDFDHRGIIQSLNPAAEAMFGYASAELVGQHITRIIPVLESAGQGNGSGNAEPVGCNRAGERFPAEISLSHLQVGGRRTSIVIVHDVTERKKMEALMAEQKAFVENLVQNCAVPLFVIDPRHRVLVWNRACEELTGVKREAMLDRDGAWRAFYERERPVLADMIIEGDQEELSRNYPVFGRSRFIPEGLEAEGWYPNLNGKDRYIFFNAAPIRNGAGELLAVIETLEDITERKEYEAQLEYQANHDRLTNLPNRNLLSDRINQALLISHRNQKNMAVLSIDLDNFKLVNDSLGQEAGDSLLKIVAERLDSCVRSGDTAARKGGDEFAVVVANLANGDDAALIASQIRQAIGAPVRLGDHELSSTCSIGISIYPKDGDDLQTLLRNADVAMYRAKEQGGGTSSSTPAR